MATIQSGKPGAVLKGWTIIGTLIAPKDATIMDCDFIAERPSRLQRILRFLRLWKPGVGLRIVGDR